MADLLGVRCAPAAQPIAAADAAPATTERLEKKRGFCGPMA